MSSIPSPLRQAYVVLQEAAEEGFDWDSPFAAAEKVREELEEVLEALTQLPISIREQALKEEIGDLFLACTCLARHCNVDPDEAIVFGVNKFMKRYAHLKSYLHEQDTSLKESSSSELSLLWQQLKKEKTK